MHTMCTMWILPVVKPRGLAMSDMGMQGGAPNNPQTLWLCQQLAGTPLVPPQPDDAVVWLEQGFLSSEPLIWGLRGGPLCRWAFDGAWSAAMCLGVAGAGIIWDPPAVAGCAPLCVQMGFITKPKTVCGT